jgi:hypothetical protein
MITEAQKLSLITAALLTFKIQKGLNFNPVNFDMYIDKPNNNSLCSIYIHSKRQDDSFRLKLYVTNFSTFTNIDGYFFTQEENYSTGNNDEIHVSNCTLSKTEFRSFEMYLYSQQFQQDILLASDNIQKEDNTGFFLLENGQGYLVAEH